MGEGCFVRCFGLCSVFVSSFEVVDLMESEEEDWGKLGRLFFRLLSMRS